MQPQPKLAPNHRPIRCRRCSAPQLAPLIKIRPYDNDVFRCPRCDLIFSPPNPSQGR